MTARSKAEVIAAFGARGTGKTAWMIRQVQDDPRLIVWDFKHDPRLKGIGQPFTSLGDMIRAMAAPRFRLHYLIDHDKPVLEQFEFFCRAAWQQSRLRMFVAELPEVTRAGGGLPVWRKCVNIGRLYEGGKWLSIITEAQRPAEVDKSLFGNCDLIHTGRLSTASDCKLFNQLFGMDVRELASMPDLHWIEKRAGSLQLTRGVFTFGNSPKKSSKRP